MSFRSLARNRDFTVLWIGTTISELGSGVSLIAFPFLTWATTHSTLATSVVGAAVAVGRLVTVLPAGHWADIYDRKLLMRLSAGSGTIALGSLSVAGLLGHVTLAHLIVAAVVVGGAEGLFSPAESSAVRTVVPAEELATAFSQNQARQHIAELVGGPLGGALYGFGRLVPFVADAVSYAVNFVMLGFLKTDLGHPQREDDAPPQGMVAGVVEGWRFVFTDPIFRVLGIASPLMNLVINAIFFAAELRLIQDGFPAWQVGLAMAIVGVFGIVGSLAAPWIIDRLPTGWLMLLSVWSFVPLLVPMALWNSPWVLAAAASAGIFLNPAGNAGISAYRQATTSPEILGRVGSTMMFTSMSLHWGAPLLGGAALALLGGTQGMLLLALAMALVALVPTFSKAVRAVPRPQVWRAELAAAVDEIAS